MDRQRSLNLSLKGNLSAAENDCRVKSSELEIAKRKYEPRHDGKQLSLLYVSLSHDSQCWCSCWCISTPIVLLGRLSSSSLAWFLILNLSLHFIWRSLLSTHPLCGLLVTVSCRNTYHLSEWISVHLLDAISESRNGWLIVLMTSPPTTSSLPFSSSLPNSFFLFSFFSSSYTVYAPSRVNVKPPNCCSLRWPLKDSSSKTGICVSKCNWRMLRTQGTDSGSDSTIQCDGGLSLLEVSFRDSALQPFTRILLSCIRCY